MKQPIYFQDFATTRIKITSIRNFEYDRQFVNTSRWKMMPTNIVFSTVAKTQFSLCRSYNIDHYDKKVRRDSIT